MLPPENVTAAILSYAVSHLQEGTGKLRKTCADTVGHLTESVPSLPVSEKWPPAQRFDDYVADRRSPIQVLTQRKAAWLVWSPGTGHLPHTEHYRYIKNKINSKIKKSNDSSFVILRFEISKFSNIGRSTFGSSKCCSQPFKKMSQQCNKCLRVNKR